MCMDNELHEADSLREQLRLKLLEAKALVTDIEVDTLPSEVLLPDETLVLGQLPPDTPTSTELIDEDRGTY